MDSNFEVKLWRHPGKHRELELCLTRGKRDMIASIPLEEWELLVSEVEMLRSLEERGARLQARINDNPDIQAFIARQRAAAKSAPVEQEDPDLERLRRRFLP